MTDQQRRWTHEEVKRLLEISVIANFKNLIAHPERPYRLQIAGDYAVNALKVLAESEVLPDDIRGQLLHILELHEQVSNPFLGMDLPEKKEEAQS